MPVCFYTFLMTILVLVYPVIIIVFQMIVKSEIMSMTLYLFLLFKPKIMFITLTTDIVCLWETLYH